MTSRIPYKTLTITNQAQARDGKALDVTTGNPVAGGSTLRNSPTVITKVDTKSTRFDNGLIDVSLIPFMRSLNVEFVAFGLRPNRRVWFFFDGVDVSNRIVKSDHIILNELSNNAVFLYGVANSDYITSGAGANSARVLLSRRLYTSNDPVGPLVYRPRMLSVSNVSGEFAVNSSFSGSGSGTPGTVGTYIMRGDYKLGNSGGNSFGSLNANSIVLSTASKNMPNNYWGTSGSNNAILIPHGRRGITLRPEAKANIVGFNNVTRTLTFSQTFSSLFPNEPAPITANQLSTTFIDTTSGLNDFFTTSEGMISGIFVVPAGIFRVGDRIFRIIDVPTNVEADCTTRADYTFTAYGINQTKNDTVVAAKAQTVAVTTPTRPGISDAGAFNSAPQGRPDSRDPVAQSFFVDGAVYSNGIFISKIEVWFHNKDDTLPVTLSIRPTVNGYPSSSETLEFAQAVLQSEEITTYPTSPYDANGNPVTGSIFTFPNPIYCAPGEYAIVVKSDSPNYEIWLSELGQTVVGTTRKVSEQPYVGSYFKSQNASTWEPSQLEDMMFRIYKCIFSPTGTVQFYNNRPESNVVADNIYTHTEDILYPNTSVSYTHSYDSGVTTSPYNPDTNFIPTARIVYSSLADGNYRLTGTLNTNDTDVSPVLKTDSYMTLAIENLINKANLSPSDITITASGAGFAQNANVAIAFSNGFSSTGFTAVGYALANINGSGTGSNGVFSINITDGGSGYINTASAIIVGGDNNAKLSVSSELRPSGGPAIAKYISRTVTLAEGFEASDIQVYITAYKPSGTDIKVYYKIKNALDPDPFANKNYFLMRQITPDRAKSLNINDPIEYSYDASSTANSTTYTSGTTTYTTFNQFALKIIMTSDNTVNVPILYDLRAIALPGSA